MIVEFDNNPEQRILPRLVYTGSKAASLPLPPSGVGTSTMSVNYGNDGGSEGDSISTDALPPLKSIWDCPKLIKGQVSGPQNTMVTGWLCLWCPGGGEFKGDNATKALAHVAKVAGRNVRFCEGNIPQAKLKQYRDLYYSKTAERADRNNRQDVLNSNIQDIQSRAINAMGGGLVDGNVAANVSTFEPPHKRPFIHPNQGSNFTGSTISSGSTRGMSSCFSPSIDHGNNHRVVAKGQMKLWRANDSAASDRMDMAIADFVHSNCLPFSLAEDPKFLRVIEVAKSLGPYKPPSRKDIGEKYLDALHEMNWKEQMKTIVCEGNVFGITIFGDGATIKSVPLINVLAAGVNNPFALLSIADCTAHLAAGGMKDAVHIAKIIEPLIEQLEGKVDNNKRKCVGIVDLVFFDGASNVQNAGELLKVKFPRITVGHGAEHVVSLFFSDVYKNVSYVHGLCGCCN